MNLLGLMDVSASALQAQRVRAEVVAVNMANAETTRTPDGGPYQRQHVVFESAGSGSFGDSLAQQMTGAGGGVSPSQGGLLWGAQPPLNVLTGSTGATAPGGVSVAGIIQDTSNPLRRYEPGHPDADASGYVNYPDINPVTEMVDLMGATRSYGMNASAVQAEKNMVTASLNLLK